MVFQQFNLFPHLTVLQNLTLAPMKLKKVPESVAKEKALDLLKKVGLDDKANAYPALAKEGMTMVVVTHKMGFAKEVAKRVIEKPNFHEWEGSCCNTSIYPLAENKALLASSDFYVPDENVVKKKGIKTVEIVVEK